MAARRSRTREPEPPLGLQRRLLAELAIVFLGVSLASLADDYRREREDDALSRQVVAALGRSLVDLGKHEHDVGTGLDAELARFDSDRKRGLRPVPPVYREGMAERPPTLVWNALIESGGARLLPPDLLFDFARFFNRMDSFGERYIRYNQFSEERFLPVVEQGEAAFYRPDGSLKPDFREHLERLRELRRMEKALLAEGAELRSALDALD